MKPLADTRSFPPVPEKQGPGNSDALQVFRAIRKLCRFDGGEVEFWQEYARRSAELCRSPIAFFLAVDDEKWKAVQLHSQVPIDDATQEDLIRQTLTLYKRMKERLFIFEPLHARKFEVQSPFLIVSKIGGAQGASPILMAVITDHSRPDLFNEIVVRTQLVHSVYYAYRNYVSDRTPAVNLSDGSLVYALELLDDVIGQKKFVLACMTLVNELATHFNLSKVSIGWKGQDYIKTVAVSHLEKFDKNSKAIIELEALFEEAADQEKEIVLPDGANLEKTVTRNHGIYKSGKNLSQLITIPIYANKAAVAAVTMERIEDAMGATDIKLISIALNQVGPWLQELHSRDQWLGRKTLNAVKNHLAWWLGPQNTWTKLFAVLFLTLLVTLSVVKMDFRLESTATLETDNVAYLSAPYHGFVEEINVHAGDHVARGQLLIHLDTEELELKELEEEANVQRFTREAEKARSSRSLADMKVALARVKQAETELKRIRFYLGQSRITSPFDGIVVYGDKLELQGAPVSKGDLLLKVANPTELYLKIKLDERDIDFVKLGARGELKLLSQPDTFHMVKIDKIIPVAKVDPNHGNIFEIKAELEGRPASWWRPGMSGVVYIKVDERPVLWVLLRRTIDAVRMKLWF